MIVKVNLWPESQMCVGCKHGSLIDDTEKYGSSAYICEFAMSPDGIGDEGCSKCEIIPIGKDEAKGAEK